MDILLDTHTAIWFFQDVEKLSKPAYNAICNLENRVYVSIASVWEIAIKLGIGKLKLNGGIESFISAIYKNDFEYAYITNLSGESDNCNR